MMRRPLLRALFYLAHEFRRPDVYRLADEIPVSLLWEWVAYLEMANKGQLDWKPADQLAQQFGLRLGRK